MKRSRTTLLTLGTAAVLGLAACGGGGGFEEEPTEQSSADGPVELTMLIASSGDAETQAVQEAVDAWAEESGNTVTVNPAADMTQELAQGFAGGNPPDLFYLDASRFADYAANGSLYSYGEDLADADDFYDSLTESFTFEDELYCAPKDFSTLALQINTAAWEEAGLTDDDVPTTWEELADVAEQLTTGDQVGLGLGTGIDRAGAFVVQAGGWWVDDAGTAATGATPEVEEGLGYLQENIEAGSFALANQLDSGWGGEAFGNQRAAMTVEGNWIKGAMTNDFPDVDYRTVELPEGPGGQGTLLFTQCWGIAADSDAQAQAVELVEHLTAADQQLTFAEAFGVMPSRESLGEQFAETYPDDAAFVAGGDYGRGPISAPGMEQVVADLNSQLENLGRADLPQVLERFDENADAALGQ